MISSVDRFKGSMLGLAVGDALGWPVEFKSPASFAVVTEMLSKKDKYPPGTWSDDTAMALCLAESLIHEKGFSPIDVMDRYMMWWEKGHMSPLGKCYGMGGTVKKALQLFSARGRMDPFCGTDDEFSAGNGCIMRLAPVPLFFSGNYAVAVQKSKESARTTHGARACVDAAGYFGGLIAAAVNGVPKEEILSCLYSPMKGLWDKEPLCPEITAVVRGSFKTKEPPDIKGTGYVVEALEAALWAFYKGNDFKECLVKAVNLGNDADTTGAICGQLAGAYYGFDSIPKEWADKVAWRDKIMTVAENLYIFSGLGKNTD